MIQFKATAICFGVLALWAGNSLAQNIPTKANSEVSQAMAPLTAQERLDAIRHSLVEASLQTPTKVLSTSWFDTTGALRETSSFKNNMQVQNLRVMSYDRDEIGQPKARLEIEQAAPQTTATSRKGLDAVVEAIQKKLKQLGSEQNKNTTSENAKQLSSDPNFQTCGKTLKKGLRHMISMDVLVDSSNPSALKVAVSELINEHLTIAQPHGSDTKWRMSSVNNKPSIANAMTVYERALTQEQPEQMPWQARMAMKTEMLPAPGTGGLFGEKGPSMLVTMMLQVSPREGQKSSLREVVTLNLELEKDPWKPAKLSSESQARLSEQFVEWKNAIGKLVDCEPVLPTVTSVKAETLQINAGSVAGIRKGDEWLIADPQKFPSQLVGKDGASQTLLAKVDSVSNYQSTLSILAGPAKSIEEQWRAWPTENLVKEPAQSPSGNGFFNKR
jgi:hypothetical protein